MNAACSSWLVLIEQRIPCPGAALSMLGSILPQSLMEQMRHRLAAGQLDGGNSWLRIPSPQMILACIKLTKIKQNPA